MAVEAPVIINCRLSDPDIRPFWPAGWACFSCHQAGRVFKHMDGGLGMGVCGSNVCDERADRPRHIEEGAATRFTCK